MPTKYFVTFCVLLIVPLLCLAAVVSYCCFRASVTAGIVALCVCLALTAIVIALFAIKMRKKR